MKNFTFFLLIALGLIYYGKHIVESGKFQNFLDVNKDYILVEQVQYYVGYFYYLKSQYRKSIKHFDNFVKLYPKSRFRESVDYTVAVCNEEINNRQEARRLFEEFLDKYPDAEKRSLVIKKIQILF
ncbi:MAG: tetratricopeptide repeat protein [bacterium]